MTRRQFENALAEYGCTADITYIGRLGDYDVIVDAPAGKCFEPGLHCLVHDTLTGNMAGEKARVHREALADMEGHLPLQDCTDVECDICHPEEALPNARD